MAPPIQTARWLRRLLTATTLAALILSATLWFRSGHANDRVEGAVAGVTVIVASKEGAVAIVVARAPGSLCKS